MGRLTVPGEPGDLPEETSLFVDLHGQRVQGGLSALYDFIRTARIHRRAQFFMLMSFVTFGFAADVINEGVVSALWPPDTAGLSSDANRTVTTLQTSEDTIKSLDKMVVEATRQQRQLETGRSLSIIRSDEWAGTTMSLADIIGRQSGVQTRRYGGAGSFQTVSIRGIKGSEVLVMLDNVPINSAMGGAADLGKINPMLIKEIELHKGVVPCLLGGNSMGGVVNLRTRPDTRKNLLEVQASTGSFGTRRLHAGVFHNIGNSASVFSQASYSQSRNDFPYLDRNNTLYGPADKGDHDPSRDDTVRTLRNNQYRAFDFTLHPSFDLRAAHARIASGFCYSNGTYHIPAFEGRTNETARYCEEKILATVGLTNDDNNDGPRLLPRFAYFRNDGITEWTDRDSGFGSSHGGVIRYGRSGILDQSIHFDLEWPLTLGEHFEIDALLFSRASDDKPRYDRDGSLHGDWRSQNARGGAAADVRARFGRLSITAGASLCGEYDRTDGGIDGVSNHVVEPADTITSLWAGALGASTSALPGMILYVNCGRYCDEPSLRERFGAKGAVMANPELQPETGYTMESGVKKDFGRCYVECCGFFVRAVNTIIFDRDGYQVRPINNSGSRIFGLELSADAQASSFLRLRCAATWQHTENLQHLYRGNMLPDEPDLSVNGDIIVTPLPNVSFSWQPQFKSFYYHDRANSPQFRVPVLNNAIAGNGSWGFLFHNFRAAWRAFGQFELSGSARNVTFRRAGSPGSQIESGYSWILYPVNEWCVNMTYSFRGPRK